MSRPLKASSRPPAWAFITATSGRVGSDGQSGADAEKAASRPRAYRSLSACAIRPLEWIWEGLIARGKLTLVSGEPGVGKSLFALQVAAMVTRGRTLPTMAGSTDLESEVSSDRPCRGLQGQVGGLSTERQGYDRGTPLGAGCANETHCEAGNVVLFSAHDAVADTIGPRLKQAGADLERVTVLCQDDHAAADGAAGNGNGDQSATGEAARTVSLARTFDLDRDLPLLQAHLRASREQGQDVRLIIIDPIDGLMQSAGTNAGRALVVERLTELAESFHVAVLVIGNLAAPGAGTLGSCRRTVGHELLTNAARSVLMVVRDLEADERRLVLPTKLTLGQPAAGLAFSIGQAGVEWDLTPLRLTGTEYFDQVQDRRKNPLVREEQSELARVTDWLRTRLSDGAVASVEVWRDAMEHDITYSTLRRAFRRLGGRTTKARGGTGHWYWRLPGRQEDENEIAEQERMLKDRIRAAAAAAAPAPFTRSEVAPDSWPSDEVKSKPVTPRKPILVSLGK